MDHPLSERIEELNKRKEQALAARLRASRRAPARPRQDARPRAHRVPARRRVVPRARHARPPPQTQRHPASGRTPTASSPAGARSTAARCSSSARTSRCSAARSARCSPRRSTRLMDLAIGRRAVHRPQRRRRRPHPGGRRQPRLLRRDLLPERAVVRRHPADQRDHGPVRRRRGVLARRSPTSSSWSRTRRTCSSPAPTS